MSDIKYDWKVQLSFNPANTPFEVGGSQPALGVYKVRCNRCGLAPWKNDANNFNVIPEMQIIESANDPSQVGKELKDYVSLAMGNRDAKHEKISERAFKKAAIAFNPSKSEGIAQMTTASLGPGLFAGKEAWIHYEPYTPGAADSNSYVTYLTADEAERIRGGTLKPQLRNEAERQGGGGGARPTTPTGTVEVELGIGSPSPQPPSTKVANAAGSAIDTLLL